MYLLKWILLIVVSVEIGTFIDVNILETSGLNIWLSRVIGCCATAIVAILQYHFLFKENISEKRKKLTFVKVIASLIMTLLLWMIITNAWGYTTYFFKAPGGSWTNYIYDFFSRFIWAIPAIVLLRSYADDLSTTWKQLFTNKPHMKPFIIAIVVNVLYIFVAMFVNHGGLWINPEFNLFKHFPMFIMVAFAEEIVYRGWGLNALSTFLSERKANVVSAIFFMLLHLPAYFVKLFLGGTFPIEIVAIQCVFALVLGLLFGYLYRKGKSLWSPMCVHFLCDFLSVIFIG